jgi:hypothetical protein
LVGRKKEDTAIFKEYVLRSVAVMDVPVDDGDAPESVFPLRVTRRDGDVIEQAESHPAVGRGMVAGRPHRAEGVFPGARDDPVDRVEESAGGGPGDRERLGAVVRVARAELAVSPAIDLGEDRAQVGVGVDEADLVVRRLASLHRLAFGGEARGFEPVEDGGDAARGLRVVIPRVVAGEAAVEEQGGGFHGGGGWFTRFAGTRPSRSSRRIRR